MKTNSKYLGLVTKKFNDFFLIDLKNQENFENSEKFLCKVKNDPKLNRDGVTIYSEIAVSYLQAILGDTVKITTVEGDVNLTIPSGTQPNTTLSLENKGVPRLGNPVARGNHEVLVKVKLPTRITDGERELLEGLASQYSDKNINSSSGLFSKLFGKES